MENKNTPQKKREPIFDIAKGIGIILMVYAHTYAFGKPFIYLFHMAFFFILAGYFFNPKHSENFKSLLAFVKNKWIRLALPFIIFNGMFLCLNNFFLDINIYTENPAIREIPLPLNAPKVYLNFQEILQKLFYTILLSHGTQLGGATWFLKVMFWITVSYSTVYFLAKKIKIPEKIFPLVNFMICLICLFIGYFTQKIDFTFYSFGTMFTCVFLYYIGTVFKKIDSKKYINIYSFIAALVVLIAANYKHIEIAISTNTYPNILTLLVLSISGYIVIMWLSGIINNNTICSKFFAYIGQNTMPIILLHFLAFKIVSLMQVWIYNLPDFYLASFPVVYGCSEKIVPLWFTLYTIVGVSVPILLNIIFKNFKSKFLKIK